MTMSRRHLRQLLVWTSCALGATSYASCTNYQSTTLGTEDAGGDDAGGLNPVGREAGADGAMAGDGATGNYRVGGSIMGLQGSGLVLQNNAGDDLTLGAGAGSSFFFATKLRAGASYAITVKVQPSGSPGEVCGVTNASGVVAATDITTVGVVCAGPRKVFVSSVLYSGNLGGLAGADAKCQGLATAASLAGTYKAWLSDDQASPSTRFTQSAAPYVLVDGTKIADNWVGLISGTLANPISKTEKGGAPPLGDTACGGSNVWSNTSTSGTKAFAGADACMNWTSATGTTAYGRALDATSSWTFRCSGGTCAWNEPIYCFQQ